MKNKKDPGFRYWFRKRRGIKSKDLGWGWVPISWEGWIVVLEFIFLISLFAWYFDLWMPSATTAKAVYFLISLISLMFVFSLIAMIRTKP
jgi:hypothetical protein